LFLGLLDGKEGVPHYATSAKVIFLCFLVLLFIIYYFFDKAVTNCWVWKIDATPFRKAALLDDELRRDFSVNFSLKTNLFFYNFGFSKDPWLLTMNSRVSSFCMQYYKPDLHKNELVKQVREKKKKKLRFLKK
jgi:hypothetical protein